MQFKNFSKAALLLGAVAVFVSSLSAAFAADSTKSAASSISVASPALASFPQLESDDLLVNILTNHPDAFEELVGGDDPTCQASGRDCSTSNGCEKCVRQDIVISIGPISFNIPRCYCDD